jgi:hypothetical protein
MKCYATMENNDCWNTHNTGTPLLDYNVVTMGTKAIAGVHLQWEPRSQLTTIPSYHITTMTLESTVTFVLAFDQ